MLIPLLEADHHVTRGGSSCDECPANNVPDLNLSSELSEIGELHQTREKVRNTDTSCTSGAVSETRQPHGATTTTS